MYFEGSLLGQGIVPLGAAANKNGYALDDPRAVESMPDGMKDLCWKDDIDKIMEYYGIPKQRVSVLSGKTGRYITNKENQQMFLAMDILPVHIPLVEDHFIKLGNPFIPNYLFAKKQFNEARQQSVSMSQPEGGRKDPITGQFIDKDGNVINGGKNPNPYGSIEGAYNNINGHADQVPANGQSNGAGESGQLPTQPSESSGEIQNPMSEQQDGTGETGGQANGEVLNAAS